MFPVRGNGSFLYKEKFFIWSFIKFTTAHKYSEHPIDWEEQNLPPKKNPTQTNLKPNNKI